MGNIYRNGAVVLGLLVMIIGMGVALPASAVVIIEDFVDDMGNDAFDPAFNHALTGGAALSGGEVVMVPGQDEITFNLDPGQFVQFASVTADSNNVPVEVEFFSDGSSVTLMTGAFGGTVDSSGTGLSEISKIRVQGLESALTQVLIDVIPEPASALMLGAGVLALLSRRRQGMA